MDIDLARPTDVNEIFTLLQLCGAHMRENGIMQWNENYPLKSHVEKDIDSKSMYCLRKDKQILGIIVIDENQSPEYEDLNWSFIENPILVVHRFAVLPSSQKNGLGKVLMDFALDFAIDTGYKSIRLDAYSGNERTVNFYKNRGYNKIGEIYFPYRTKHFDCFEKSLI